MSVKWQSQAWHVIIIFIITGTPQSAEGLKPGQRQSARLKKRRGEVVGEDKEGSPEPQPGPSGENPVTGRRYTNKIVVQFIKIFMFKFIRFVIF
jgi:hypothetical protein